jgi:hypothetical protein
MLLTHVSLGLLVVVAIAIFLQAGAAVLATVFRNGRWPPLAETVSLAFGLGVGAIGTQMLLFSLLGVSYTLPALLAPWAVGWLLYARYRAGARPSPSMARDGASRWSTCEVVVACLLAVLVGALLVRAAVWPLWWWDTWAIWGLKAKAFYHFRDATPFVADGYYAVTHPDYPILYPLAGTLLFLVLGESHDVVQVLPVLFYASSLLLFRSLLLRCGAARCAAALSTAALACAPNILSFAQEYLAEQAALWFALGAVGYTFVYARVRETEWLILAALSAAFLTQVRAEGMLIVAPIMLFLIVDAAIAGRTPGHLVRVRGIVSFGAIVACVYVPWLVFSRIKVGVTGGVSQIGVGDLLRGTNELLPILHTTAEWMTGTAWLGPYVLLFPLLAFLVLANLRSYVSSLWQIYWLVMLAASAAPPVILLMTLPYWRSVPAMSRYLFLFTALSLLIVALHVGRLWPAPRSPVDTAPGERLGVRFFGTGIVAVLIAAVITSASGLLRHADANTADWVFADGPSGWRPGPATTLSRAFGAVELSSTEASIWLMSPEGINLDGDLNPILRVQLRVQKAAMPGQIRLWWKPPGSVFSWAHTVTETAWWTGAFQTIALRPAWTGPIAELRLQIDNPAAAADEPFAAFIRSIRSDGRVAGLVTLVFSRHASNPWPLVLAAIAVWAALDRPRSLIAAQRVACTVVAVVALAVWVLADSSSAFSFPVAARPVQVVSDVVKSSRELAPLLRWERLAYLERQAGRPQFAALIRLIRHVEAACPDGQDVLIWTAADPADGGYLVQRSWYLLFPRKVHVVQSPDVLQALLTRDAPVGALIGYGVPVPSTVSGEQAYRESGDLFGVCQPVLAVAQP